MIAELFTVRLIALRLAVHLFRYGSLEYSKKLSIRNTFQSSKHAGVATGRPLAGDDNSSDHRSGR